MFYNTVSHTGQNLTQKRENANVQDRRVYAIIIANQADVLTPRSIQKLYRKKYGNILITSVRRSIDTLKKKKVIETRDEIVKSFVKDDSYDGGGYQTREKRIFLCEF